MEGQKLIDTISDCCASPLCEVATGRILGEGEVLRIKLDVNGFAPHVTEHPLLPEMHTDIQRGYYGGIFIGTYREYMTYFWGDIWGNQMCKIIGTHLTLNSNGKEVAQIIN
tara:strand:+ start:222 stop:554 length:333 start_codon:yes stop_codon:yes gene_type:complete